MNESDERVELGFGLAVGRGLLFREVLDKGKIMVGKGDGTKDYLGSRESGEKGNINRVCKTR